MVATKFEILQYRPKSPAPDGRIGGQCRRGHEFTGQNTRILKSGKRTCRECVRNTARERMRRIRAALKNSVPSPGSA